MEGKIKTQQDTLEQLEVKLKSLEEQNKENSKKDGKIQNLMEEIDKLRLEKRSLEVKLWEAKRDLEQKQQLSSDTKKDVVHVEEKLHKVHNNRLVFCRAYFIGWYCNYLAHLSVCLFTLLLHHDFFPFLVTISLLPISPISTFLLAL